MRREDEIIQLLVLAADFLGHPEVQKIPFSLSPKTVVKQLRALAREIQDDLDRVEAKIQSMKMKHT